ncbi:MAG TPA: glycosyltransferase family 39 protein [Acidobacteriota bacterium]|nr:glycosyltransferase family 39 protein [Acidobacteriota bacterium]
MKRPPRGARTAPPKPRHAAHWWTHAAVFGAALAVRLIYFAAVDQPPVQFDARQYVSAGLAAPVAVTNPSLLRDTERLRDLDFELLYNDLIADEEVSWFPYAAPKFGQAVNEVFFAGPIYPVFLGGVFRIAPGYDFWVVRILQAILDSLTAVLIWGLMSRLVAPAGGWIAAGLWIVYGPAIYKTGELITETASIFLGVLTLWFLVRGFDRRRYRWLILAGLSLGILSSTKASTSALIVPLGIAWLWANRARWRWALGGGAVMAVATAAVLVPWVLAVHWRYDVWSLRDPAYGGGNLRSANILASEGHNLDLAPDDFWTYPVWREIKNHPLQYAGLWLRKFYRMWFRASDDYRRAYPFGATGVLWLHRLTVLVALAGLMIWPVRAGPVAWLPLAFVGYFVAIHLPMHAISRYNLVAMPVVCGAAAVGLLWLADAEKPGVVLRILRVVVIPLAVALGLLIVQPSHWMIWSSIPSNLAVVLFIVTGAGLIVGGLWRVVALVRDHRSTRNRVGVVVAAILVAVFLAQRLPAEGHAEWQVKLDRPGKLAQRVVTFPDWLVADSITHVFVFMDITAEQGKHCNVRLEVDHLGTLIAVDSLVDSLSFYGKPSYRPFLEAYGLRRCEVRNWAHYRIPAAVFREMLADRQMQITLSGEPTGPNPGGLILRGGLPRTDYHDWWGPGFEYTAVERLYEGRDPRVWEDLPLEFETAVCALFDNGSRSVSDLSDGWGRQTGQYRLIVRLLMPDGTWRYF